MDVKIFWSKHVVLVKPFQRSLEQSSKTLVERKRVVEKVIVGEKRENDRESKVDREREGKRKQSV